MLILTRRLGETLIIGDDITVTVLGMKGYQIRLGINAPKKVSVHREEIYQRIKRENKKQDEITEEELELLADAVTESTEKATKSLEEVHTDIQDTRMYLAKSKNSF